MVHGGGHHSGGGFGGGGGGHHHHHHHSSWNRSNRDHSSNVMIVNNNNDSYFSSYQQNYGSFAAGARPVGGRSWRGSWREHSSSAFCLPCCLGCCCCCIERRHRHRVPWICMSTILFLFLLYMSTVQETWTMDAGESRQVPSGFLASQLSIGVATSGRVNVYTLPLMCPALTGPTVVLHENETIQLAAGDYQYDYFYVNAGSIISLTVEQTMGATNAMIIRGKNFDDNEDYQSGTVWKRFVTTREATEYKVPETGYYTLVYDNASLAKGTLVVSYVITLTTYDVQGLVPQVCGDPDDCAIDTSNKCILVQPPEISDHDEKVVTVQINTIARNWYLLLLLAAIPLLLGLAFEQTRTSPMTESGYFDDDSAEYERPPDASPESIAPFVVEPTAPIDPATNVDYESFPIAYAVKASHD